MAVMKERKEKNYLSDNDKTRIGTQGSAIKVESTA